MAYNPTQWRDRVVERPRTYSLQDNGDGTYTLLPMPGNIIEPGTPVNAGNMNKIEQGIADTSQGLEQHINANTGVHGATPNATPSRIVMRDGNGRAAVSNPVNNDHIANKQYVDGAIDAITSGDITVIPSIPDGNASGDNIPVGVTMFTISSGSTGYFYPYSLIVNFKTTNHRLTQWCFKNGDAEDGAAYRHWYTGKGWSDWFEVWDSKSLPNPARRNIDNNFISQTINGELRLSGRLASTVLPNNSQIINQSSSLNRIWVGNPQTHLRFESDGDIDASVTGRGLVTLWHTGLLRWNNGVLQYNDNGTWRAVGGMKGVQRGVTTIREGENVANVTISSVNRDKAYVVLPNLIYSGTESSSLQLRAELTSATNLRFNFTYYEPGTTTAEQQIAWQVVEYY